MAISAPVRCSFANNDTGIGRWFSSCLNSKSMSQTARKRLKLLGKPTQALDIVVLRAGDDAIGTETELQQFANVEIVGPHRLGFNTLGDGHVVVTFVAVPNQLNPFLLRHLVSGACRFPAGDASFLDHRHRPQRDRTAGPRVHHRDRHLA